MKKKMILALALVLLAVAGCGKNATPGGNDPAKSVTPGTSSGSGTGGSTPANPSTGSNGAGGGNTTPGQQPKPTLEKVTLGPLKVGDVAKVGPLEVKVVNIIVKKKAPGLPANSTLAYVLVLVNIKNTGTTEYPINLTEHFKFFNVEAKTYVMSTAATNTEENRLTGTVSAGETREGYIGYMPKLVPGTNKLVYQHPDWGTATWEYQS